MRATCQRTARGAVLGMIRGEFGGISGFRKILIVTDFGGATRIVFPPRGGRQTAKRSDEGDAKRGGRGDPMARPGRPSRSPTAVSLVVPLVRPCGPPSPARGESRHDDPPKSVTVRKNQASRPGASSKSRGANAHPPPIVVLLRRYRCTSRNPPFSPRGRRCPGGADEGGATGGRRLQCLRMKSGATAVAPSSGLRPPSPTRGEGCLSSPNSAFSRRSTGRLNSGGRRSGAGGGGPSSPGTSS